MNISHKGIVIIPLAIVAIGIAAASAYILNDPAAFSTPTHAPVPVAVKAPTQVPEKIYTPEQIKQGTAEAVIRARDAKRVSDMLQIQLAVEQYNDRCNQYPTTLDIALDSGCPNGITLGSFISKIPTGPNAGETYGYATNVTATDYFVQATMETAPEKNINITADHLLVVPAWYPASKNASSPAGLSCTGNNYCFEAK